MKTKKHEARLNIKAGEKYNSLTILREVEKYKLPSGQTNRAFLCKCDCGNEKVIRLLHLIRGRITTCGCSTERHGMSKTRLYRSWSAMRDRATLPTYINAKRYYYRGIGICEEWRSSFTCFMNWALKNGYDDTKQLDRIDNNKGYSPDNCRFVSNIDNANNKENTFYVNYNNREVPFMQLMRELGINEIHYAAIRQRINLGWDHKEAIEKPIRNGKYKNRFNSKFKKESTESN